MMDDTQRKAHIDAAAAKALLLQPGESFVIRVDGDSAYLQRCAYDVEAAIEAEYENAGELRSMMAHPDELYAAPLDMEPHKRLVIGRAGDDGEDIS